MSLLPDWKALLRHAWSIRMILLAGAFSAAEVSLRLLPGHFEPGTFAALSGLTTLGAVVARLLAQPKSLPK